MNKDSYLPLFRKYRPQSFKDVIGQDFTVTALQNAIKLNKIANAYLFCGPRGTGKTSSARIFAKSLNCVNGPTIDPCQKCQSCLDVTNASGLDVIEIDAATNRGIDDAKELISKVQYAPMNGKYKIFIIDEVHMLSKEAFNALLKTFEEPPENVIFILATTEPHKVLETIVSRCQRFDFRRITIDDIKKRLREISDIEKINIDDEALYAIAKNVSGGMRDSLALLDQASILGLEKTITKDVIEDLIGKITFETLYDLMEKILNEDIEEAVLAVEKIYEKGSEPRNFAENFIEFLRNIIFTISSKDKDSISALTLFNEETINKIKDNPKLEQKTVLQILDKTIEFYKEIKVSANPYLWAELMIISLASKNNTKESTVVKIPVSQTTFNNQDIKPYKEEKSDIKIETKNETENIENTTLETKNETISDKNENNIKESEIKPENISENKNPASIWAEILSKVESIPAKFFYSGVGKLVNIDNTCHITLGFVNQNAISQAKSDNKYKPLIKAINAVLGENGSIEFVTITKSTKIIETKLNVTIADNPKPKNEFQNFKNENSNTETDKKEKIKQDNEEDSIQDIEIYSKDEEEKTDITQYPETTRKMLETFSGKVIE